MHLPARMPWRGAQHASLSKHAPGRVFSVQVVREDASCKTDSRDGDVGFRLQARDGDREGPREQ